MIKKQKSILFLGLIRNLEYFYRNIEIALRLRDSSLIDNIYCVIWKSDAEKNLKEINFLEKNNIIFKIEKDLEDNAILEGKNGSGMKVLHSISVGLGLYKKNQNIFKTRYDLLLTEEILSKILGTDLSYKTKESYFSSKLLVPGAHLSKPYFFIDWFYYSDLLTLKRLNRLPTNRFLKSAKIFKKLNIPIEIGLGTWQFIAPFAETSPLVDAYMMISPFFIHQKRTYQFREHLKKSLKTKSFIYLIFLYLLNINENIIIFPPTGLGFHSRRANFRQDNQYYEGKYKTNKPNFLFYKSNIFKYWPLPTKRIKNVFLHTNEVIKDFPSKNTFFMIFDDVIKEFESRNSYDLSSIAEEFKNEQTKIIQSIYKLKDKEIFNAFWK